MSSTPALSLQRTMLPVALTIDTVEALAADFSAYCADGPCVTLDATQVEVLTTPGVQLILSFSKSLEAQGISLRIIHAKPAVTQVFERLGLATQFSGWEA